MANNNIKLQNLRHSCAHLLAATILEMYPGAKNAIGPAIDNGFYQDFDLGEHKISENDFPVIENRMHERVLKWDKFTEKQVSVEQAKADFSWNPYKQELIDEFATEGKIITENNPGDFLDLCKGGHCDNPAHELKNFKLLSVAGAYWRGSEKNKMLTRIYGTYFETKDELDKYLWQINEAKKRDHKKIGIELDLFTYSDLVGPGLPLWTPKGTIIRQILDDFVWTLRREKGYQRVEIPHITKSDLYKISGHWDKFKNELFIIKTREGHTFAMKPMNCPHHTQIYNHRQRSYRDLPQRYANTTMCYRDEQTGELSGLSRVRSFTQDDAHVFCRQNQIKDEILKIWDIVDNFYQPFGFNLRVRLSLHDPKNMKAYLGKESSWRSAEKALIDIAKQKKAKYFIATGEAAFYGPKIDFMAYDSLSREWQVATIQLDMNMPDRFDLVCIDENGQQERIVMIHAAIMGSIERFLSILIEHYAGNFPTWLSPVQVLILPVSEKHLLTSHKVFEIMLQDGIRVQIDNDNKTLGAKIRQGVLQKIPYLCIIGDKEEEKSTNTDMKISVRGRTKELGLTSVNEFLKSIKDQVDKKI
ncbi:threonine--tRNA ligase [Candidatus Roizmanbacteria bacterium RIFCSPLOWO2_02_FULL_38_10]|uniref:Threonine--tRNA ligase n=1 Tax=Candidatus Roizmanbacteria bacterium RIFCSPLOWO2_02_FULL_38_10 TaxID=1802074 RepID=A0A1F7JP71_9BACT|nr:MAG: threonine--tRNA ligase [Candidatus Roizmanbacteria bacterium RIFCSPLOWO2_02_FULL_38_10]